MGRPGVQLLRRTLLLLLSRIKACVLLLYKTMSLRTPDPILRMDPVLRLMTWLVAHPVH